MARVPRVSEQVGGSVQLQAPGVAPVQDQTGNQLHRAGRALQFAGQGVQRLGDDIRERNDAARISEADSLYGDFVRQRLNPMDGYRSLQGRAAGDQYDAVRRDMEQKRDEIARTLQSDEQRHVFNRAAQARAQQAYGVIDSHAGRQTSIYEASQHSAAIKGHAADYAENLGDPIAMAKSLELMKRSVNSMADSAGVAPEVREQLMTEAMTGVHSQTIDTLIAGGDSQGARDYFSANSKAMSVDVRNKAQRIIKNAGIADKGQRTSEFIQTKGANYLDRVEMLDAMHERGDISIEVRDNAANRLRTAANEQRTETTRRATEALKSATDWAAAGNELTPHMIEELDSTGQRWKFDFVRENGGLRITSQTGHRALHTTTDEQFAQFKSADEVWLHYQTEMDTDGQAEMVSRWKSAMVRIGKATAEQRDAWNEDLIAVKFADAAGHHFRRLPGVADDLDLKEADPVKLSNWKRALRQEAEAIGKEKGLKKMNAATIDEAANNLLNPQRLPIEVDGEARNLAGLSSSEVERAQLVLPDDLAEEFGSRVFDLNLVRPEDLDAARQDLNRKLQAAKDSGDSSRTVSKITPRTVYMHAIANKVQADKSEKQEARRDTARGYRLVSERFLGMLSDPDVAAQLRDPFRSAKGRKTIFGGRIPDYRYPDHRSREDELVGIAFERFGAELANAHGIAFDDLDAHFRFLIKNPKQQIKPSRDIKGPSRKPKVENE